MVFGTGLLEEDMQQMKDEFNYQIFISLIWGNLQYLGSVLQKLVDNPEIYICTSRKILFWHFTSMHKLCSIVLFFTIANLSTRPILITALNQTLVYGRLFLPHVFLLYHKFQGLLMNFPANVEIGFILQWGRIFLNTVAHQNVIIYNLFRKCPMSKSVSQFNNPGIKCDETNEQQKLKDITK